MRRSVKKMRDQQLLKSLGYIPIPVNFVTYAQKCDAFSNKFTIKFVDAYFAHRRSIQHEGKDKNGGVKKPSSSKQHFSVYLSTPAGMVAMLYNDDVGGFNYYSDRTIKASILNSVAMHYSLCTQNYTIYNLTMENLNFYADVKQLCRTNVGDAKDTDAHSNSQLPKVVPPNVFAKLKKRGSGVKPRVLATRCVTKCASIPEETDDICVEQKDDDNQYGTHAQLFEKTESAENGSGKMRHINKFIRKGSIADYFEQMAAECKKMLDAAAAAAAPKLRPTTVDTNCTYAEFKRLRSATAASKPKNDRESDGVGKRDTAMAAL